YHALRLAGAKLALEDFTDGFSSAARLIAYPWDYCKIDVDKVGQVIVSAAFGYCQTSGIAVIAELVENQSCAQAMLNAGIALHRGFHWHKPTIITDAVTRPVSC